MVKVKKLNSADNKYTVTFSYQPLTAGKHTVFLAGDFNDFSAEKNQLEEKNGVYYCSLELPRGKYCYKFIVDGNWITDIDTEEIEADGYGGHNSVLYVGSQEEILSFRIVTFTWEKTENVNTVFLAGSFNNWAPDQDQLLKNATGDFEISVPLKRGKYSYRFVVDGLWKTDPQSAEREVNYLNESNSVINVDGRFPLLGTQNITRIITFGLHKKDIHKYCDVLSKNRLLFHAASYNNNCTGITLILNDIYYPMELIDNNHSQEYFQKEIEWNGKDFNFGFLYENPTQKLLLGSEGFHHEISEKHYFRFSKAEFELFVTPEWAKKGIIYQIFIDRFYNGNPENDQDFKEWYYEGLTNPPPPGKKLSSQQPCYNFVNDWYDCSGLRQSPFHADGIADHFSFYGGDLAGIRQKLDYLADLGITIIYLNPLFEARSNHKYDCADYKKIDPHFGTSEEFKKLVENCHARNMKIILDVAFNHTGDTFWAFTDAREKGPESDYFHWYEWKKWPLPQNEDYIPSEYYSCWWGLGHMPDLDYDKSRFSPEENPIRNIQEAEPNWDVVNYILDVAAYWLKEMDIDGFRLDVPNEVPFWFWKLFRQKVKSLKSDAYIVGEIWHNAEEWIGNNYFDAVMNYACFKDPVILFFNLRKCTAKDFDKALKPGLMNYPWQAVQVMMNLLDSHDTFRYLEIAQGDFSRLKMALIFQMTYPGIPHIWYGDEIGMMGAHDPDCRRPFNWKYEADSKKVGLHNFYKKLIRIRKENPSLVSGSFKPLYLEGMIYAYSRILADQEILVILNNDKTDNLISLLRTDCHQYSDLLSDKNYLTEDGYLNLTLKKYSGAILLKV
ncbi:MAG: hypothetical protein APR54_03090 [Candidatus Cloacimonas sp. SDB]|nr:MAG: hypothetical protein APR54_03090 [Candidatus Cloacimonas sp. SDB]